MRETFGKNGLNWAVNFENLLIWRGIEKIYN